MTKKVIAVDRRKAEERAARGEALETLDAFAKRVGVDVACWAMRKHLAIAAARRSTDREIRDLQDKLAKLEGSAAK